MAQTSEVLETSDVLSRDLYLQKYIKYFNSPDEVFRKHKVSTWFYEKFAFNNTLNNFISLQQFSNIIKFWDSRFNIIKEIKFEFGKNYRTIKADLPDLIGKEYYTQNVQNITRTSSLLIDEKNNDILICYYSQTYPQGETDVFSENVIIDKNIIILDEKGNWLYDSPYKTNGSFVPFHFENNMIYGTEINEKKHLEIVCYKI